MISNQSDQTTPSLYTCQGLAGIDMRSLSSSHDLHIYHIVKCLYLLYERLNLLILGGYITKKLELFFLSPLKSSCRFSKEVKALPWLVRRVKMITSKPVRPLRVLKLGKGRDNQVDINPFYISSLFELQYQGIRTHYIIKLP